jgi:hypothetical protein
MRYGIMLIVGGLLALMVPPSHADDTALTGRQAFLNCECWFPCFSPETGRFSRKTGIP